MDFLTQTILIRHSLYFCKNSRKPAAHANAVGVKDDGFSVVELVVSTLLLALLIVATLSLFTTSTQATRRTGSYGNLNALIDQDLAKLREIGDEFSYCAVASGSADPATNSVCGLVSGVKDSVDYFPLPVNSDGSTNASYSSLRTSFINACRANDSTNVASAVITAMNDVAPPAGITRSIVRDSTDTASSYLIRVTYSSSGSLPFSSASLQRVAKVYPTVASWCP